MYFKELPNNINIQFLNTSNISVNEGNIISLKINDEPIFLGYIFSLKINQDNIYNIKAYDQTRYLITRDTYIYTNKKANQIISMICDDFDLKKGEIEDTNYIIPYRIEENQTIFDIIYTALDITKKNNGEQYIFFDNYGKLCLKKYSSMKTNIIIDLDKGVNSYIIEKTIDKDVYNSVKILIKDKKTKVISTYKKEDEETKKKWGTLRYFEKLSNDFTIGQAQNYAQNILNLKNKNKFIVKLEIFGNEKIRAGNIITILKDEKIKDMIVESCSHLIMNNEYKLKLNLIEV